MRPKLVQEVDRLELSSDLSLVNIEIAANKK